MLFLSSLVRQKFLFELETKSLLKLLRNQFGSPLLKFDEIHSWNVQKRQPCRCYSTEKVKDELVKSSGSQGSEISTSRIENIKETTKTVSYSGIILIGLGISGIIFYTIFRELFSGNSPSNIYSKAFNRCLKNDKVVMSLGEPIRAFGEENSRGRRHHTNHLLYSKDGVNYLRMKFFIKGSRKKATVHLEMQENERRNFDYRYLFVQVDEYPYTTIVLEDNRAESAVNSPVKPPKEELALM